MRFTDTALLTITCSKVGFASVKCIAYAKSNTI